jgi:RNA-binding protein YhbY
LKRIKYPLPIPELIQIIFNGAEGITDNELREIDDQIEAKQADTVL